MRKNTGDYLPVFLYTVAVIGIFLLSVLVDLRVAMPERTARYLGFFILYSGVGLIIWSVVYIKKAFCGEVEPVLDLLIQDGPYRFVRYPVYLRMAIAFIGNTEELVGTPGSLCYVLTEERTLAARFGEEWEIYRRKTGLIFPVFKIKD